MFTVAWWYLLATYGMLWAGLLADPVWFYAAIGSCLIQAVHFGIEDKNFFSFSCQVRYAMAGMFAAGLWEPLGWIYWLPIAGLTARLTVNYCLLARLVSLLPWNRKGPFSAALFKKTIFSKPVNGRILLAVLAAVTMVAPAYADMVEVRDKGFLNGKILKQDGAQMHFKDASGETHVFDKKDVLFVELEKEPPVTDKLKKIFEKEKEPPKKTVPASAKAGTPASSAAPASGGLMSDLMQQMQSAQAVAAASNARTQKQMEALMKANEGSVGYGESMPEKEKSRFRSLED